MSEKIYTKNAPDAIGPYSQAVKSGNLLFTSGQIAINPQQAMLTLRASRLRPVRSARTLKQFWQRQAALLTMLSRPPASLTT